MLRGEEGGGADIHDSFSDVMARPGRGVGEGEGRRGEGGREKGERGR